MELDADQQDALSLKVRHELWNRGQLAWKLHAAQKLIYDELAGTTKSRVYLGCSRQWGKSTLLLLLAWELALCTPGSRILYFAPTAKDAEKIATDRAQWLLSDCPAALKPVYNATSKEYRFDNGSEISFVGANGDRARYARGATIHLGIVDEAAEVDDLNYLVNDVLAPMTLHTAGRLLFASTPARNPGHASTELAKKCALNDKFVYFKFTIHDNPLLSQATIDEYCAQAGGVSSATWRREYLADLDVVDRDTAVIPEFDSIARAEIIGPPPEPPQFVDRYTSIDPGLVNDPTGILFAYWDWQARKLVIQAEALLKGAVTRVINDTVSAREAALWPGQKVFMRVIDDPSKRIIADLYDLYKLAFTAAVKPDREGGINLLREWVAARLLIIDPSCVQLIRQLAYATFNKAGGLERTAADGHMDLLDALLYLVRTVHANRFRNPTPKDFGFNPLTMVRREPATKANPLARALLGNTPVGRRILKKVQG